MRIKKINISGFKSFCDSTQVVFDHSVTAVVGPNGCGKSNIVDAVRWALGEQSSKNLRGKAMEDVIFSGSESRGPQSVAEVTITFDNTDGLSHSSYLDFSEIAVTRRLHRDGTSEYLINNTPCRLMDITDLFLGTGGGARAYSIIEQGRIGLIVSARSEERRGIIEEAAGITKYKSARRLSERRMDKTRQNLLRVTDVVNEMERTISSLNRQAKKTERYKRYRAEQTDLELQVASHRYLELRAEKMVAEEMLATKQEELVDTRNAFSATEARVSSMRLDEHSTRSNLDEIQASGYDIDNKIQVIENEIKHLKDAMDRHRVEETQAAEQQALAFKQREEMRDEATLLLKQMDRVERDGEATTTRLSDLSTRAEQARYQLKGLAEDHDAKREGISRARARQAAAVSAVENLDRRIEDTEARAKSAHEEHASLSQQAETLTSQASQLKERTLEIEERLNTIRSTEVQEKEIFGRLGQEVEACDEERRRIRDDLQTQTSRRASLKELMSSLESHDNAVREAVAMVDEGDEILLNGLLIDSVECPERFEQALGAALNDRLQALCVEDRNVGLQLLAMLKERDMGRVTVVALNGSNNNVQDASVDDPNVLGPLFGFLKVAPAVKDVMQGLLSGVFVVERLSEAEQLFQANDKKAAFVTLDGQYLEDNGTMRGGRASSLGADLLGNKRRIRELSVEIDSLSALHDDIEQRFEALKEDLNFRRDAGEKARQDAQEQEIVLAEVRRDSVRATDDYDLLSQRSISMEQEIAHQEEMLAQARADQEQAVVDGKEAQIEIETLEHLLNEQSSEIESCQKKSEELAQATGDLRVQQAGLDQQRQNILERQAQLKRALEEIDKSLKQAEQKRTSAFAEVGISAGEAFRQKEQLISLLDEAEHTKAQVEALRHELDEKEARLTEVEAEAKTIRAEADDIAGEVSELQIRERESGLAITHLLESMQTHNDVNLLRVLGDYHLRPLSGQEEKARIEELQRLVNRMGPINLAAIEEFQRESKRYEELTVQKTDLEQALEDLERAIARMDKDSKARFKETFEDVNRRFREIFPRLFEGGSARLDLTDPNDLLHTGVDIVAHPPGKRPSNIELLSGGEKALTAVSLLFAIFLHRPSPFCILDEVDAPLDEANVGRFNETVRQMTDRSQFILITHSSLTMEMSDTLYGVTMEEPGVSKMVSVRLNTPDQAKAVNS